MAHHSSNPTEYNPERDYHQVMNGFKIGGVIFIGFTIFLAFLIG